MSNSNSWANPSQASPADAIQMAAFLEERSRVPDAREVNQKLCQVMAAKAGERLLEVGSGSGVLCRMLAAYVLPAGCVTGVDISPEMTAEAWKYALAEGIQTGIAFETSPAETLPYPDASFDGALAARILLHVADPEAVIREMTRVVKPGGRVLVMDWDFETVTVDHPNRDLTRRILHWRNDQHGGNNWSGRQLWRRMHAAGIQNLSVHPCVAVANSEAEGLTQSLWRAAQVACEGGAISQAEHETWAQVLKERIHTGTFFASIVYFILQGNVFSHQKVLV